MQSPRGQFFYRGQTPWPPAGVGAVKVTDGRMERRSVVIAIITIGLVHDTASVTAECCAADEPIQLGRN